MASKKRYRPKRTLRDTGMAQLRGMWEPQDLSEFEHDWSNVLEGAIKGMGLEDRFNEEQVFAAWETTVDPGIAQHARPVALERKVLSIQVLHSSVFYELERMKGMILAKMQKEFGANHIREIRFRLG